MDAHQVGETPQGEVPAGLDPDLLGRHLAQLTEREEFASATMKIKDMGGQTHELDFGDIETVEPVANEPRFRITKRNGVMMAVTGAAIATALGVGIRYWRKRRSS